MKLSKLSNKPTAYKKGWIEFYKLKFKVTPDILIPRPETELLVDEVLRVIASEAKQSITILDLGTGSGNISISIAKNAPNVKIIATDISAKALKVARQNAKLHGVENKITFIGSDLLHAFCHSGEDQNPDLLDSGVTPLPPMTTDIIVTNLPYIPTQRIPYLDSSVKDFEPYIALNGGEDGFELYRKLFRQIKKLNLKPKLIIGEIDYTHGEIALNEAQKYFPNAQIEIKTDLTHKQRILLIF